MIGQILRILRYHFMPASEERKKLDRHEMILLELQTQNRQILRKQELIIEQLNGATSTKRHQSSQLMPFAYAHKQNELEVLLEELEKYRRKDVPSTPDEYVFDFTIVSKEKIYAVFREIGTCLAIKQRALVDYIIECTNLSDNYNTVRNHLR